MRQVIHCGHQGAEADSIDVQHRGSTEDIKTRILHISMMSTTYAETSL